MWLMIDEPVASFIADARQCCLELGNAICDPNHVEQIYSAIPVDVELTKDQLDLLL